MGNHQSSPSHDRHSRLSKSRSNATHTAPVVLVDSSPISVASRYADLSLKNRHHIKETLLSPTTTTAEVGETEPLGKDDTVVEQAPANTHTRGRPLSIISRSNSRQNSKQNSRSNSLSCFGSRRGSHTRLVGLVDSKAPGTSNGPVDVDAAIKILQEVKRNASPEDLAALRKFKHSLG
jgi:hypothetical protein